MPSVDPSSTLGRSLKNCFGNGLYSDLRIKDANGHEYAVHRVVVCGQSPVLANACKAEHGFKEAQTGVINLEHDHPDAVKHMLEFMYSGSYEIDYSHALLQHARAYAIGEIYDVPELKDSAAAEFQDLSLIEWDLEDFTDAVRFIYENVPDSDKGGIRDIASRVIADHCSVFLTVPEFEALLDDFSAIGKDVLRTLAKGS